MEQKKILWVVVSMSAFVLIIFGIALYMSAPFRNKSTSTAPESTDVGVIQRGEQDPDIDPVKWSRDPASIPPLESETPSSVNVVNNVNVVNGDSAPSAGQNGDGSIDIGDLITPNKTEEETGTLPENLAKDIGAGEQKQREEKSKSEKKLQTGVSGRKGTLEKNTSKPKREEKTAAAVKPSKPNASSAQKTLETIYWVQTASLSSRLNAENARDTLAEKHMNVEIFTKETSVGLTHRVRVGPFKNKTEAEYWLKKVRAIKGFEGSYIAQDRKKA